MRLRPLCKALLLLCLCVVPGMAANGQTLAIRRPHQPRKVDQITHAGKGQTLVEPSLKSKTVVVVPRTIAPRKLLVRHKTLCRPKLCSSASGVNGATPTSTKGSAQIPLPERGKWLHTLTSLVAVLLLYPT